MCYQDKIAGIYNEYWLYLDKDVKYVLGMEKCSIALLSSLLNILDNSVMTFYQAMQSHHGNSDIGEM